MSNIQGLYSVFYLLTFCLVLTLFIDSYIGSHNFALINIYKDRFQLSSTKSTKCKFYRTEWFTHFFYFKGVEKDKCSVGGGKWTLLGIGGIFRYTSALRRGKLVKTCSVKNAEITNTHECSLCQQITGKVSQKFAFPCQR